MVTKVPRSSPAAKRRKNAAHRRKPWVVKTKHGISPSGAEEPHDLSLVFTHPNVYDCKNAPAWRRGDSVLATRFRKSLMLPPLFALLCLSLLPARAQDPARVTDDTYSKWLNEDVRWIITDQERAEFKKLTDEKQRDQFIEAFWARRNPVSDAPENTFKEQHYRRLAYANQHFAQGIPGWKTDRGRFYIMYGPPDKVIHHLNSDQQPDGSRKGRFDSEEWHWTYIDGLGCNVILKFEDKCGCGEYHLSEGQGGFRSPHMLGPDCLINQILLP
jgi:GWxTD domain-containing protein